MPKPNKIMWIFGPSGSGKTTLATKLAHDFQGLLIDADNMRKVWNIEPNFSRQGRLEFQEKLRDSASEWEYRWDVFHDLMVVASITPYQEMRDLNRRKIDNYFDVYLSCDLDILIKRDPKGLYAKALGGDIGNFFAHFECPVGRQCDLPKLVIETGRASVDESYTILKKYYQEEVSDD